MKITKETQCCISIAESPGNLGATIFNSCFDALSLDYIYKPCKVSANSLDGAIQGIRSLGIRGCGVSMPHKTKVIEYLNEIDPKAKKIGAVNTVVNDNGILYGHNTDFLGAKQAIKEKYNTSQKKVLIVGAGGVSRAIIMALKENGASKIYITNRDEEKGQLLAKEFELQYIHYDEINDFEGDFLINATSVGMTPNDKEIIISKEMVANYEAVMDVVVSPFKTLLVQTALDLGKIVIYGHEMAVYQAGAQFKLYTGKDAPIDVMFESLKKNLVTK
ncbi:shikimate dehydrogenase [Patescibacteria group bacterium]